MFKDNLTHLRKLNHMTQEDIAEKLEVPPKGKHLFGMVTVGDKGQIVIPAKARKLFNISSGDELVVLGDETQGIALLKANDFLFHVFSYIFTSLIIL